MHKNIDASEWDSPKREQQNSCGNRVEKTREKRRSLTRPPSPWHSPLTSVSLLAQPSIQHAQVSRQYLSSPFCLVVCCLRKTIFSPYLAISIPVVLHLHSISSRLVLIVSYFWGVVICFIRESIHLSMTKISYYQCRTIMLCRLAICQPSSMVSRSTQATMGRSSSTHHGR